MKRVVLIIKNETWNGANVKGFKKNYKKRDVQFCQIQKCKSLYLLRFCLETDKKPTS